MPFGISFDPAGHLVVAETGLNALASYKLNRNGTITLIDSVPSGQAATCWVAPIKGGLAAGGEGIVALSSLD